MHSDLDHKVLDAINGYILGNFLYDAGFFSLYQTCTDVGNVCRPVLFMYRLYRRYF